MLGSNGSKPRENRAVFDPLNCGHNAGVRPKRNGRSVDETGGADDSAIPRATYSATDKYGRTCTCKFVVNRYGPNTLSAPNRVPKRRSFLRLNLT